MKKGKTTLILLLLLFIIMLHSSSNTIASNTNQPKISIKGIIYVDRGPIKILNDSAFELYGFSGTGNYDDPYIIDGFNITDSIIDLIYIENTIKHFTISDCYLNSGNSTTSNCTTLVNVTNGLINNNIMCNTNLTGISLISSYRNVISNNLIQDCNQTGISLANSSKNIISNNTINNCLTPMGSTHGYGIFITQPSANNTISNNRITNCTSSAIMLASLLSSFRGNNSILYNRVFYCTFSIYLYGYDNNTISNNIIYKAPLLGMFLIYSNNNTITYNNIYNSTTSAMTLDASSDNIIRFNSIYNNSNYGFFIDDFFSPSINNSVNWNNFINNSASFPGNPQAFDEGINTNVSHNYWHDYTGSGNYTLDANFPPYQNDTSPLTNPVPPRVNIITPLAQSYGINTITVTLGGNALNYQYYISPVDSVNQTWNGSIDRALAEGIYTLHAYGKILSSTTHVSVTFTIDTSKPAVNITSPTSTTYKQDNVTLTYTAIGGTVTIYQDGKANTSSVPSGSIITDLDDGEHNITVTVIDKSNDLAEDSVIFTIDTSEDDTTTSEGGSFPGIATVILFFITFVVVIKRRKKT